MRQFQQHYVAGDRPSRSIKFLADDDFTDRNANSETVRLWLAMLADDRDGFVDADGGLKSAGQQSSDA